MNKFNFNEAEVAEFCTGFGDAVLKIEDVGYLNELVNLSVTVEGYTLLLADRFAESLEFESLEFLSPLSNHGKVITLNCNDASVTVLITWYDSKPLKIVTRQYKILGRNVVIDVGSPYPYPDGYAR